MASFCVNVHSTLFSGVNIVFYWHTMESISREPPITPLFRPRYADQPQPPIAQVICVHRGCQRAACSEPGSGLIDGTPRPVSHCARSHPSILTSPGAAAYPLRRGRGGEGGGTQGEKWYGWPTAWETPDK